MEVLQCSNWSEYHAIISNIKKRNAQKIIDGVTTEERILFRGQGNSVWMPQTTLERSKSGNCSLLEYTKSVYSVVPHIQRLTRKNWELPNLKEREKSVLSGHHGYIPVILGLKFWTYLRHHGFPSPLLDWSQSSLIAAFFAFNKISPAKKVAVFVYIESPRGNKDTVVDGPFITTYKHEIQTHPRHFAQKCQSTITTKRINGVISFCPHLDVFSLNRNDQDMIIKIEIPQSERKNALRSLKSQNISRKDLFYPEDVLIDKLSREKYP